MSEITIALDAGHGGSDSGAVYKSRKEKDAVTMLSIYGGKLPTIFINRTGMNPYAARMKAMLIFAFFPLVVLLAQPLGTVSPWFPVILIGIGGAAHQSWSANIFSTVGDMFPRTAIASITGIGGMAGGVGSMILQKVAGNLFVYASGTTMVDGKEVEMTTSPMSMTVGRMRTLACIRKVVEMQRPATIRFSASSVTMLR